MNLNDDFEEIFSKQGNTLLDETFNEASSYVRKKTSEISKENLLYLYGRYKYACEGACDSDRPGGLFNLEAKTKWDSWKALGSTLTKDKAKEDYISKLTDLFPNWKDEGKSQADQFSNAGKAGTFGVKASTMAKELVNEADRNCFDLCREGSVQKLSEYLNKNPKLINQVDENKMTMAMWACDRGHLDILQLLVEKGSDLNKQDSDGQTVLHYCCSNDQVEIVKYLLKNKKLLNINIKDNDGQRAVETTDNKELISLINSIS